MSAALLWRYGGAGLGATEFDPRRGAAATRLASVPMRALLPIIAALLICGCARGVRPDEASSDLPPDTGFRLRPKLGGEKGQLGVILTPPGELPVWSCEGPVADGVFGCPEATEWFRGPGRYEVLAELKLEGDMLRASGAVEVREEGPVSAALWYVAEPKPHLEFSAAVEERRPSAGATGILSRAQILEGVKRGEAGVKGCYAGAASDSPGLEARVETWFLIGADGAVEAASARGAPRHPELVYCVLAKVRALRFPAPEGGALAVTYPFVFAQ